MCAAPIRSGTPAIGVGTGNVPVIVDETADLDDAAQKICASKIFDNSTSCSSENSVIIVDAVYDKAIAALERVGGYMASGSREGEDPGALWPDGKLSRTLIARDADVLARGCGLPAAAESKKFFMVEETGVGRGFPVLRREAVAGADRLSRQGFRRRRSTRADEILAHQGRGHSVGLHTKDMARARASSPSDTDVVRVLINQAHTFGNGGGFDNGLNFTLSMGCGTWGGNCITDNLNYSTSSTSPTSSPPSPKTSRARKPVRRLLDEVREVTIAAVFLRLTMRPGMFRNDARSPV